MVNMVQKRLTTKEYWGHIWGKKSLPSIASPPHDMKKMLEKLLPKSKEISLIEIGCAIGGWMAYFNKNFGYSVTGIEYVEHAADTTRENLKLQNIAAEIITEDFFEVELTPAGYDVVFSAGFIE